MICPDPFCQLPNDGHTHVTALDGLVNALHELRIKDQPDGPCWCAVGPNNTFPNHERPCANARAALLQVRGAA